MRPSRFPISVAVLSAALLSVAVGCGGDTETSDTSDTSESASSADAIVVTDPPATTSLTSATAPAGTSAVASAPTAATTVPAASATTAVSDASAAPAGGPITDPCALLTAKVAAEVLGGPVGEPTAQPGTGNNTCSYEGVDVNTPGLVLLTTYNVTGTEAVLEMAAQEFAGATPVDGVGDAAQVSVQAQVIGVLFGETVFGLAIFRGSPDGQMMPVDEDQLIAAANAVLAGQ